MSGEGLGLGRARQRRGRIDREMVPLWAMRVDAGEVLVGLGLERPGG